MVNMVRMVSYSEQTGNSSLAFGRRLSVSDAILDRMGMYTRAMTWLQARCEAESKAAVMRQVGAAKAAFYKAMGGTQEPSAGNCMA